MITKDYHIIGSVSAQSIMRKRRYYDMAPAVIPTKYNARRDLRILFPVIVDSSTTLGMTMGVVFNLLSLMMFRVVVIWIMVFRIMFRVMLMMRLFFFDIRFQFLNIHIRPYFRTEKG